MDFHSPIYHVGTFDFPRSSRELDVTPLVLPSSYDGTISNGTLAYS